MDRVEMKEEALARMKALKLHKNVINEFKNEDKLNVSYPPFGALYWANEDEMKLIKAAEEHYNILVYHAIRTETIFGSLLSMLYVSSYDEELEYDREDLEALCPHAYVENLSEPMFSEFGSIGIQPVAGGILRTA